MSTYTELKGLKVKYLDSDPSPGTEGDVWYNSASGQLKAFIATSAWSSSAPMTISKYAAQGGGTQTAAFVTGGGPGSEPPFPGNASSTTVEYNGSGWSSGGALGMARYAGAAAGTLTAGILAAGYNQQSPYGRNLTETYDGSSWTEVGDLSSARYNTGSAIGTQTATVVGNGIQFPGGPMPVLLPSGTVEEFDGSSWTAGGDRGSANLAGVNYGTLTAGVSATGGTAVPGTPKTTDVKNYDGTSWTAAPSINTARRELGGGGVQTAAIIFGGDPDPGSSTNATESFDGTSWTTSPATMGTALVNMGFSSNSTSTAAFAGGGSNPGPVTNVTEEFNTSISTITAGAWASGGNMNTARGYIAGFGIQTSAVAAGGYNGTARVSNVEEYNGSSWANATALPGAYAYGGGAGTEPAGLFWGGTNPGGIVDSTFESDGSSWTSGGDLSTGKYNTGSAGTQTAALAAGGVPPDSTPPYTNNTEEYDGSSWTAGGNMNSYSQAMGGAGTQTAGVMFGRGASPSDHDKNIEEYNGSSWTTSPAKMQVCEEFSASSQNAPSSDSIIFGDSSATVSTEQWNGTICVTAPNLAAARSKAGGAGTGSSGLAFGGLTPGAINTTEEFTAETSAATASTIDFD